MIRLHISPALIGQGSFVRRAVEWDGCTVRELAEREKPAEWGDVPIQIAVDGGLVEGEDLDRSMPDDVDVIIAPAIALAGLVPLAISFIASAAINTGLNYLASLLIPTPKPPGLTQDRGDRASATYAWDGLETGYGQGSAIGTLYGEHDVGGQVIYANVFAQSQPGGTLVERLNIVLALCGGGRIESIGGVTGGPNGEADGLDGLGPSTLLPANIRVNENLLDATFNPFLVEPLATAWIRCGEYSQSPLPAPFTGAATTFVVNTQLDDIAEAVFTYSGTEDLDTAIFIIKFPAGVFWQNGSGFFPAAPRGAGDPGIHFEFDWRPVGSGAWNPFYAGGVVFPEQALGQVPIQGVAAFTLSASFRQFATSAAVSGPVEIRVRRTDPAFPNTTTSSAVEHALWQQLVITQRAGLGYPGTALLGLELDASEKFNGRLPSFAIRAKGKRVRVWDQALGWSLPVWEVASLPLQFQFMKYAPGNNPAWVALDFLLSPEGMGNKLTEENIDLQAFRNWSIFCDNEPGPSGFEWSEPRFRFDGVFDRPRAAWEWLTTICAAGRAAPLWRGNKVSVVYQYRDAHTDGGTMPRLTIPAKTKTQVFCDANVTDLTIEYISRGGRPSVIAYTFANASKQYRLDEFPVEETESFFSYLSEFPAERTEDLRRETTEALGVVRTTQLYRDGVFRHRLHRLARSIITFRTGIWALAAEPGDLIGFQHDVLRPYANQSFGLTVEKGVVAGLVVTVDRVLTPTGGTDKLIMRGPAGEVVEATVASIAGKVVTLTTPIAVNGVAATNVSVNPGAACAFGRMSQVLKEYTILSTTLDRDGMRVVRAVEYQPLVFEEPRVGSGGSEETSFDAAPGQPDSRNEPYRVDAADIRVVPSPLAPGRQLVTWAKPQGRGRYRCRVYARPTGGTKWWHLGEVRGQDAQIEWDGMAPWQSWDVVVGVEDDRGQFPMPEELTPATVTAQEFPVFVPPAITQPLGSNTRDARAYLFAWNPVHFDQFAYYEARVGTEWVGAKVIYRGETPSFAWDRTPKFWDKVMIAVRSRSGLYGARLEITQPSSFLPEGMSAGAADINEIPPVATVPPELTYDAGAAEIRVTDGFYGGTFTATAIDLGSVQDAWWSVSAAMEQRDDFTIDELGDFEVGSGEAIWRTVNAREASVHAPGLLWDETIDSIGDVPIDDLGARTVAGLPGVAGDHVLFRVESRFHDGTTWGGWVEHTNGFRRAQKMEARFQLFRDNMKRNGYVKRFQLSVAV